MMLPELKEFQRIVYRNFVSVFSKMADQVVDRRGYRAIHSAIDYPFFNSVLCTQQEDNLASLIHAVKEDYQRLHRPFCWWHTELTTPSDLPLHLARAGFEPCEGFAGMICDLDKIDEDISLNESVIIEHLSSRDEIKDWMIPIAKSFDFSASVAQFYHDVWDKHFDNSNIIHIKALIDGKLVGTGTLCIEPDACGLYNLSVLPEYRNHKIATTIQAYRLRLAKEIGCKYAVLQASKMAVHLDARCGFKKVMSFTPYMLA